MYYRITYNDIGIYEALRNNISFKEWKLLLNSNAFNWLPKSPIYLSGYFSYFTELGFELFKQLVLPICEKYLDKNNILIIQYEYINDKIIYQDKYQIVIDKNI